MSDAPVREAWRRGRVWLAVFAVLVVAAAAVATVSGTPAQPLGATSTAPDGSRALVRVLRGYGVTVRAVSTLAGATRAGAVVVTSPDDYSDTQLRDLRSRVDRLVLVRPGTRAVTAVAADVSPEPDRRAATSPGCSDPDASAAGGLDPPGDTLVYGGGRGFVRCYGGAVLVAPHLVILGSSDALTNARLRDAGVAALDVDTITGGRSITSVAWLRTGADAAGNGSASVRDLFPGSVFRVLWWAVVVALLVVAWRARRLGPPAVEPLPVVVRAVETVEGHGRLYLRAGARDRAAWALRQAALARLRTALGLPRSAEVAEVAAVLGPLIDRSDLARVLGGPAPADDGALRLLAADLHDIERATHLGVATTGGNVRVH